MKYRRGKGKEGVSGKESVEATESTELLQRVVFGKLLSVLHGGHGSASPNHNGATWVGVGSECGCVVVPWVCLLLCGFCWVLCHSPPRLCHLQAWQGAAPMALGGGGSCIQLNCSQQSRSWSGK